MVSNGPLQFLRGRYTGPGAPEWVLGLATTALLSGNIQTRFNTEGLQNANRYYFKVAGVYAFQNLGIAIDILIISAVVGWLVWPHGRKGFELAAMIGALLGPPIVWGELILALYTQPNGVFVLDSLPVRPVNNLGVLGASVFFLYLLSKQQFSKKMWIDLLVKLVSATVVVLGQTLIFQTLVARHPQ